MRIKTISDMGLYILYIVDINNSIVINKDIYEKLIDLEQISEEYFLEIIHLLYPNEIEKYEKILFSRKNVLKNQEIMNQEGYDILTGKSNFTLCIHATRKCNLQCKYCFGGEDYLPKQEISVEVAKKAIDYMVYDYGKNGKMYTIDLAGSGEPLLRFDFIKEIEEHCSKIRDILGKKIIITFPTNATLLREEHIEYMKQHPDVLYGISLDGDEQCNCNRVYANKRSSFQDVLKGVDITANEHCGFAVTVTQYNERIDEVYDYIYSLKTGDAISAHLVRDFGDSETSLYKVDIDKLIEAYRRLTDKFIQKMQEGDYEYVKPILNGDDVYGSYILLAIQKGLIAKSRCDAGQNRMAVDANGDLFACSVMNGNSDFYLGNIVSGVDIRKRERFVKNNVMESIKCRSCWCQNICRGECMAISYLTSRELYNPNEYMCQIKQKLIELAISFVEYVKRNIPDAYMGLVKYIVTTKNNYQTNSAVWAAVNCLKEFKPNVTYREVASVLENYQREQKESVQVGTRIHAIEIFLKQYNQEFAAVQISCLKDLKDIEDTLICCIRGDNGDNEYCLVKKNSNGAYILYSLESSLNDFQLTDELIKRGINVFIGPFEKMIK